MSEDGPSLTPEARRREAKRRERQATALRENLGKRKAQDRARAEMPDPAKPVSD